MAKQYGLIKPSNVFGSSDSEDDTNSKAVKKQPLLKPNMLQKKQIQKMHEQAVEEDPNIFLYDEVYDDIQNKRNEAKNQKKAQEDKKPKYIKKLIETAEKRKKEYERRIERQVQKEREAEGEKFKDKEIFVTSTYRKKLEEIKEAELEEKRQEYLESIGDVTKQADLSGFYRHLYSQKLDTEPKPEEVDSKPQDQEVDTKPEGKNSKSINDTSQKKKNYRKRESSNDEEPTVDEKTDAKPAKTEHLNSNLDADSDFSVDSSSEESDSENKKRVEKKIPKAENEFKEPMKPVENKNEEIEIQKSVDTDKIEDETEEVEVKLKKPKIDIWAKRTVGDLFVEAVKRYYERKAMKESGMS